MKGSRIPLEIDVFGVLANELPPNCEVLVRHYVGDWCFGLIREPHNRELYLASPWGFWRLDVQQLVTTFVDQVQDWKRGDDVSHGRGLTGPLAKFITPKMLPDAWRQVLEAAPLEKRRRGARRRRT